MLKSVCSMLRGGVEITSFGFSFFSGNSQTKFGSCRIYLHLQERVVGKLFLFFAHSLTDNLCCAKFWNYSK